jgi:hypothetical protein
LVLRLARNERLIQFYLNYYLLNGSILSRAVVRSEFFVRSKFGAERFVLFVVSCLDDLVGLPRMRGFQQAKSKFLVMKKIAELIDILKNFWSSGYNILIRCVSCAN